MRNLAALDRIVLGTVQLGLPYGRKAAAGLMSEAAAFEILDCAWAIGIRAFDTAEAYGASSARLGRWLTQTNRMQFARITTKVKLTPTSRELRSAGRAALDRFSDAAQLTLLSHGPASDSESIVIVTVARERSALAGESVYDPAEVLAAWRHAATSVVQAPANLYDQRSMIRPVAPGRVMHYRSAYLQGVLLESPDVAEQRVRGAGRLASAVARAASSVGVPAAPLLVATVLKASRSADCVVVGADVPSDLEALSSAVQTPPDVVDEFARLATVVAPVEDRVLDPRCWEFER